MSLRNIAIIAHVDHGKTTLDYGITVTVHLTFSSNYATTTAALAALHKSR